MRKAAVGLVGVLVLLAVGLAAAILLLDGERLRLLTVDYMERTTGVDVEIQRVERAVGLTPRIVIEGFTMREPEFPVSPLLELRRASFELDLLSLVRGPVELSNLAVERPHIVLPINDEGILYWGPAIANLLERLRRYDWALHGFSVSDVEIEARHTMRDADAAVTIASIEGTMPRPADLVFRVREIGGGLRTTLPIPIAGRVDIAELRLYHTDREQPVRLEVRGTVGARPLTVDLRSGNVLEGAAAARHALDATLVLGRSNMQVQGTVSRGGDRRLDADVRVVLKGFTRVPASEARFAISDRGEAWIAEDIDATVGQSKFTGHLQIERRQPRPRLTGSLHAAGLELGSLGGNGANGDDRSDGAEGSNGASGSAAAGDDSAAGSQNMFSAVTDRLDVVDAQLDLQAEDLALFAVPVASASMRVDLADARLEVAPIEFEVLGGKADARIRLAGGTTPPELELTANFYGLKISEFAEELDVDVEMFGDVDGSVELDMAGSTVDAMVGAAAGRFTLLMSGGRLSQALAKLMDMDVVELILRRLDGDDTTPIRCAIADFDGESAVFDATLILDTGSIKMVGGGSMDLAERTMDLVLQPHSKDFSLLSADAPLHVMGPFGDLSVSADMDAVVASLLTPIELGRADNAPCRELIEQASESVSVEPRQRSARGGRSGD